METSAYSELFRTPDIQVITGMEQTWVGFELSTFPAKVPSGDLLDYIQRGGRQIVPRRKLEGCRKGKQLLEGHGMSAIHSTKAQINLQKVTPLESG